jgi:ferredoxin-NADP reductase
MIAAEDNMRAMKTAFDDFSVRKSNVEAEEFEAAQRKTREDAEAVAEGQRTTLTNTLNTHRAALLAA